MAEKWTRHTSKAPLSMKCGSCRKSLTKEEISRRADWCTPCCDEAGYAARLAKAHQEAKQRRAAAYPVTKKPEQMFIGDDLS